MKRNMWTGQSNIRQRNATELSCILFRPRWFFAIVFITSVNAVHYAIAIFAAVQTNTVATASEFVTATYRLGAILLVFAVWAIREPIANIRFRNASDRIAHELIFQASVRFGWFFDNWYFSYICHSAANLIGVVAAITKQKEISLKDELFLGNHKSTKILTWFHRTSTNAAHIYHSSIGTSSRDTLALCCQSCDLFRVNWLPYNLIRHRLQCNLYRHHIAMLNKYICRHCIWTSTAHILCSNTIASHQIRQRNPKCKQQSIWSDQMDSVLIWIKFYAVVTKNYLRARYHRPTTAEYIVDRWHKKIHRLCMYLRRFYYCCTSSRQTHLHALTLKINLNLLWNSDQPVRKRNTYLGNHLHHLWMRQFVVNLWSSEWKMKLRKWYFGLPHNQTLLMQRPLLHRKYSFLHSVKVQLPSSEPSSQSVHVRQNTLSMKYEVIFKRGIDQITVIMVTDKVFWNAFIIRFALEHVRQTWMLWWRTRRLIRIIATIWIKNKCIWIEHRSIEQRTSGSNENGLPSSPSQR